MKLFNTILASFWCGLFLSAFCVVCILYAEINFFNLFIILTLFASNFFIALSKWIQVVKP